MFLQINDIKHINMIFVLMPGSCPRGGTWGQPGCTGGHILFVFRKWSCGIQIDGDDEMNRMQVKFSPYGQTDDLGVRSKGQISLSQFQ